MIQENNASQNCWFVMRDLKRSNAKLPAYKMLSENNFQVFTPMKWVVSVIKGKNIRKKVPFLQDLLFVYANRETLDPIVREIETLQYRYQTNAYKKPIIVDELEMNRFIKVVQNIDQPHYYHPSEITESMLRRKIRIIGGPLNTYEGFLVSTKGSKMKRLLVKLDNLIMASVEVNPDYIEIIK